MAQPNPTTPPDTPEPARNDLARRLARYRRRVAAEGRDRSLEVIDRAISAADEER
jgi:hypothetical protein